MADDASKPASPATPDAPALSGDDGSATLARRQRSNRTPMVAMAVAVVLGGGLAFAVVSMIPDSWKFRLKSGAGESKTEDVSTRKSEAESDGPTPDVPLGPAPEIPLRTEKPPAEKKPFTGVATEDPAVKLARRREARAAELLVDAKRLHSKKLMKAAVRVLEDLRNRYPDTKAAIEAEKLLLKID